MSEKYKDELNKKFEKIDEIISNKFGQKSNTNTYSNNNNNYSKSNSNSNNNNYSNNKVEYIVDETSAIDGGTRRLRASEIPKKIEHINTPVNKSTYYDSEGTDSSPRRVGDSLLMDILAIPFRLAIIAGISAIVGSIVVGGCSLVLGGCSIIELPEDKKIEMKSENKIEQRKEFRIIEKAIRNKNNEKKEMGIKNEKR